MTVVGTVIGETVQVTKIDYDGNPQRGLRTTCKKADGKAYEIALEADSEDKWRQLSQVATAQSNLILAGECLGRARDYGGLLLLASSAGSPVLMHTLAEDSKATGQNNVAFVSNFMLGKVRLAEFLLCCI